MLRVAREAIAPTHTQRGGGHLESVHALLILADRFRVDSIERGYPIEKQEIA